MDQFCYKARVHAEIHSQLRKVGGFLSFEDGLEFFLVLNDLGPPLRTEGFASILQLQTVPNSSWNWPRFLPASSTSAGRQPRPSEIHVFPLKAKFTGMPGASWAALHHLSCREMCPVPALHTPTHSAGNGGCTSSPRASASKSQSSSLVLSLLILHGGSALLQIPGLGWALLVPLGPQGGAIAQHRSCSLSTVLGRPWGSGSSSSCLG